MAAQRDGRVEIPGVGNEVGAAEHSLSPIIEEILDRWQHCGDDRGGNQSDFSVVVDTKISGPRVQID